MNHAAKLIAIIILSSTAVILSAASGFAQPADLPVALPPQAQPSNQAPNVSRTVDCDAGQTIQEAVDNSNTGDTILVSGTCNENVNIGAAKTSITLDGQGSATIIGAPVDDTVKILGGREITIKSFTISGGASGITLRRGTGTFDGNIIQFTGGTGISIGVGSVGRVVNNLIQDNAGNGVSVSENSTARIGLIATDVPSPSPNTIQNNGGVGISVNKTSSALIVGNVLTGNARDGVNLFAAAMADVSANTIESNHRHGIVVTENSALRLAQLSPFNTPNVTNPTAKNSLLGIFCSINSYATGSRGTLTGFSAPTFFDGTCVNGTTP